MVACSGRASFHAAPHSHHKNGCFDNATMQVYTFAALDLVLGPISHIQFIKGELRLAMPSNTYPNKVVGWDVK
jgi:hypothetical protein